jgi:Na+/melibiose symporter-like transporter
VYLFGAIGVAVLAFPLFWLLDTGSGLMAALAMFLVFIFAHAPMYGPQGAFLSELFGTRVRYSGASLGAQLASVVAGALSPFIATKLLQDYGRTSLALYLIFMAVVTIVAVAIASETHREEIDS